MPLFRRKPADEDPRPLIAAFWQWWAVARESVLAADPEQVQELVQPRVEAIHPELDWEFGGSHPATFTVSSGGRADLRGLAERWWLSAPVGDRDVTYRAVRARSVDGLQGTLHVDDFEIDLSELVTSGHVNPQTGRVDVAVHHPLFPLLNKDGRAQVAFLGLDMALGEDDVERRLGVVELAVDQPRDAFPLSGLSSVVEAMVANSAGEVILQGADNRGRVVRVVTWRPLHRVDLPLCETHLALVLPYAAGPDGQPTDAAIVERARAVAMDAVERLGGLGPRAALVALEFGQGRAVAHVMFDRWEVDVNAARPAIAGWPKADWVVAPDPTWQSVEHFLI